MASFKELSVFAFFMNARIQQYALKFRNMELEECTKTDVQESANNYTRISHCVGKVMCLNPFTKHDEQENYTRNDEAELI